jgi:hypothetical protein
MIPLAKKKLDQKRAKLAREIVQSRFEFDHPDTNIEEDLDEIGEKITLTDYLNGPIAKAVYQNTNYVWVPMYPTELDDVETIRDFGKKVYAHLAKKAAIKAEALDLFPK